MAYYEVVFESGEGSVCDYPDDAAALGALGEQNNRAVNGLEAGPQGGPAARIAKVFKYDEHPGSLNEDGMLSADVLNSELKALVTKYTDNNGVVNVMALAEGVMGIAHPMKQGAGPHESKYKMESTGELALNFEGEVQ